MVFVQLQQMITEPRLASGWDVSSLSWRDSSSCVECLPACLPAPHVPRFSADAWILTRFCVAMMMSSAFFDVVIECWGELSFCDVLSSLCVRIRRQSDMVKYVPVLTKLFFMSCRLFAFEQRRRWGRELPPCFATCWKMKKIARHMHSSHRIDQSCSRGLIHDTATDQDERWRSYQEGIYKRHEPSGTIQVIYQCATDEILINVMYVVTYNNLSSGTSSGVSHKQLRHRYMYRPRNEQILNGVTA